MPFSATLLLIGLSLLGLWVALGLLNALDCAFSDFFEDDL